MQLQEHKIANNKLIISENCSNEDLKIIQYYWDFQNQSLVNTPKSVKHKFSIDQTNLTNIIREFSTFSIYLHCEACNSYEKNEANSHSSLNAILKKQNNSYRNKFNCKLCEEQKENVLEIERLKKHKEVLQTLNTAIDSKNWQNLSNYERKMLGKCLEMSFYQLKVYYGKLLGQTHFIKLIHSLKNIANQDLIILERDTWNNYIIDYKYSDKLLEHKEEIIQLNEEPNETIDFDKETDTIKIKLTRNEHHKHHPDSPMFSGVITFKERIVIEPGVEYVFGHWQRADDNLYLTLTPQINLVKLPTQKRISKLPISLQKGVNDFLNNMGKNLNF